MSDQLNLDIKALDELQEGLLELGEKGNIAAAHYGSLMASAPSDEQRLQVANELCNKFESLVKWLVEFESWWTGASEHCPDLPPVGENRATPRVEPEGQRT